MVKEQFSSCNLQQTNQDLLTTIQEITEYYLADGYIMTLRQLFYQLVTKDIIPNKQAEYNKLSRLLKIGRMAGLIDWEIIEDRLRVPKLPYWCLDVPDALQDTIRQFRLNRQMGQNVYVELWCEKDALSNVLYKISSKYHLNLMINRGYSSCTAMHDAFNRFKHCDWVDKKVILYVGDHDPSGLDMIRDIEKRLNEFGEFPEIIPIALTEEQINTYNPPPNPAKMTDPRSDKYVKQHGHISYEVDALPPNILNQIVSQNVENHIDMSIFNEILAEEEQQKEQLTAIAESWNKNNN
jgi:hypothetical protein